MYGITPYKPFRRSIAYNPFKEMEDFERRFFGESPASFFRPAELAEFKTDITDEGDSFVLAADLPGFKKEDISLDLDGDKLTIKAVRHSEHEDKDKQGKFICCERSYGSYERAFDVSAINTDAITAKLDEGVLVLTMPKKQPQVPAVRKLEIQ